MDPGGPKTFGSNYDKLTYNSTTMLLSDAERKCHKNTDCQSVFFLQSMTEETKV
jgi:hypothetical protein